MSAISLARQPFGPDVVVPVQARVSLEQVEEAEPDALLVFFVAIDFDVAGCLS